MGRHDRRGGQQGNLHSYFSVRISSDSKESLGTINQDVMRKANTAFDAAPFRVMIKSRKM